MERSENDLVTKLLHAIRGEEKQKIVKKYPLPKRNNHYLTLRHNPAPQRIFLVTSDRPVDFNFVMNIMDFFPFVFIRILEEVYAKVIINSRIVNSWLYMPGIYNP